MDILVKTENPKALDSTIQQLGGVVMMSNDIDYMKDGESGAYVVRALSGNHRFLMMAIKQQGYGEVVGETSKYEIPTE